VGVSGQPILLADFQKMGPKRVSGRPIFLVFLADFAFCAFDTLWIIFGKCIAHGTTWI